MAWNPEPNVGAARDFGKKFGYSQVLIIGIDQVSGAFGVVSYGETKTLCADAEKRAKKLQKFIEAGGIGFF